MQKLIAQGRIHPAGLQAIKQAKKNKSWNLLKSVDTLRPPKELQLAFSNFPQAKSNFDAFPPSSRRAILEWITQAKTQPTREKRIQETVQLASQNIRANQYKK